MGPRGEKGKKALAWRASAFEERRARRKVEKTLFVGRRKKRKKTPLQLSFSLSSSSSSSYCSSLVFLLPILPTPKEMTPLLRARAPPARKKLLAARSKGVSMRRKAGRGRRDFFLILLRDLSGGGSGGGGEEEEEEEEEEEKRRSRRNKEQTSSAVASQPLSASNGSPTPTRADLDPVGGVFRARGASARAGGRGDGGGDGRKNYFFFELFSLLAHFSSFFFLQLRRRSCFCSRHAGSGGRLWLPLIF